MSLRSIYPLEQQGNLFVVRAALGSLDGTAKIVRLLLDTGADFTVLPSTVTFDGLLGMNFLKICNVTIEIGKAIVIIEN